MWRILSFSSYPAQKHWPHLQGKCDLEQDLHSWNYFLIWCNFSYFGEGYWVGGKYDVFVTYGFLIIYET